MTALYEFINPSNLNVEVIKEGEGNERQLGMSGIFIQAEQKNANGRIYPMSEISRAVQTVKEKIQNGYSVMGELDHPDNLNVNLNNVSHAITDMSMDGRNGMGKLKILNTPSGQTARALLESKIKLGVSSRGSGNVGPDGRVSDFEIVTVDIVANPSAPQAYPNAVYESKASLMALLEGKRGSVVEDLVASVIAGDPRAQKWLREEYVAWMDEVWKK